MPRAQENEKKELTREERRKVFSAGNSSGQQLKDNLGRAAKTYAARLQMESKEGESTRVLNASAYVGCSG